MTPMSYIQQAALDEPSISEFPHVFLSFWFFIYSSGGHPLPELRWTHRACFRWSGRARPTASSNGSGRCSTPGTDQGFGVFDFLKPEGSGMTKRLSLQSTNWKFIVSPRFGNDLDGLCTSMLLYFPWANSGNNTSGSFMVISTESWFLYPSDPRAQKPEDWSSSSP